MAYNCDTHPENAAAILVTNLSNGDTATACPDCILPLAAALAGGVLPEGARLEVVLPEDEQAATAPAEGDPTDDPDDTDLGADVPLPYPADTPGTGPDSDDDDGPGGFTPDPVDRALTDAPEPAPAGS